MQRNKIRILAASGPSFQVHAAYELFCAALLFLLFSYRFVKHYRSHDRKSSFNTVAFLLGMIMELGQLIRWQPYDPMCYQGKIPLVVCDVCFQFTFYTVMVLGAATLSHWVHLLSGQQRSVAWRKLSNQIFWAVLILCLCSSFIAGTVLFHSSTFVPDPLAKTGVFRSAVFSIKYISNSVMLLAMHIYGFYEGVRLLRALGGHPFKILTWRRLPSPPRHTAQAYKIFEKLFGMQVVCVAGLVFNIAVGAGLLSGPCYGVYEDMEVEQWWTLVDTLLIFIAVLMGTILRNPKSCRTTPAFSNNEPMINSFNRSKREIEQRSRESGVGLHS